MAVATETLGCWPEGAGLCMIAIEVSDATSIYIAHLWVGRFLKKAPVEISDTGFQLAACLFVSLSSRCKQIGIWVTHPLFRILFQESNSFWINPISDFIKPWIGLSNTKVIIHLKNNRRHPALVILIEQIFVIPFRESLPTWMSWKKGLLISSIIAGSHAHFRSEQLATFIRWAVYLIWSKSLIERGWFHDFPYWKLF